MEHASAPLDTRASFVAQEIKFATTTVNAFPTVHAPVIREAMDRHVNHPLNVQEDAVTDSVKMERVFAHRFGTRHIATQHLTKSVKLMTNAFRAAVKLSTLVFKGVKADLHASPHVKKCLLIALSAARISRYHTIR